MKKFLITTTIATVLLLVSGLIEMNHCRVWVTKDPPGAPKDYRTYSTFCNINAYPGLIGALMIGLVRYEVRYMHTLVSGVIRL